ncbi:MAG: deoxyribonuclease IV [Planctomycetia bacterium]|nr:deoxyribonuclease IV [Planctomycetia bacterium]
MPKFGVHESIADGFDAAVREAAAAGFDTVQIFSKNASQWNAKEIAQEEAQRFKDALAESGIVTPIIHDSYLINMASPKEDLYEKSVAAFEMELTRANQLGVRWVVTHPGAYTTGSEEEGLTRIGAAFNRVLDAVPGPVGVLLETTAGQGTCLGYNFEHLGRIRSVCRQPERMAVCLDTCHIFAAGYDFSTREKYESVLKDFDFAIGLRHIQAFHINDSVKGCGSRVDRHAPLGEGEIGEALRFFVGDPRFKELPMYLETPKGDKQLPDGSFRDYDQINLEKLKEWSRCCTK